MSLFTPPTPVIPPAPTYTTAQIIAMQQQQAKVIAQQVLSSIAQTFTQLQGELKQGVTAVWQPPGGTRNPAYPPTSQQVLDAIQAAATAQGSNAQGVMKVCSDLVAFLEQESPGSTAAITPLIKAVTNNPDGSVTVT